MADEIAKAAIDKFESLPLRLRQLDTQFTVLCGIIARNKVSSCLQVLSLCTGTKCCSHMETNRHGRGRVLSDSHAEVLARRGLERFLLLTMLSGSNPVGATATTDDVMMAYTDGKWQLRDEWELHMYISDPPCGDCAIYQRLGQSSSTSRSSCISTGGSSGSDASSGLSHTTGFTGAKLLSKSFTAPGMDAPPVAQAPATSRETGSQVLGAVRLKPMRSDLPDHKRSRSMSCSDKLCRWMRLGMQGSMLAPYLLKPISLTSIVVSKDAAALEGTQLAALQRGVLSRGPAIPAMMPNPELMLTGVQFEHSLQVTQSQYHTAVLEREQMEQEEDNDGGHEPEKKKKKVDIDVPKKSTAALKRPKPCGTSLNWVREVPSASATDKMTNKAGARKACGGGSVEATQSLTGLLLGVTEHALQCLSDNDASSPVLQGVGVGVGNDADDKAHKRYAKGDYKSTNDMPVPHIESRLSRRSLAALAARLLTQDQGQDPCLYSDWKTGGKHACMAYAEQRARFLAAAPFDQWVSDDLEQEDFQVRVGDP